MSINYSTIAGNHYERVSAQQDGGTQYGIRDKANGNVAFFGSDADWCQTTFDRLKNGTQTALTWRTADELGNPFVYEVLDSTDVDWATATDPAPAEDRTAQGRALAAMRRREAELTAQVATLTQQRDANATVATNLRSDLQRVWQGLSEQADEREWCSEFDEFHANYGGDAYITLEKEVEVTLRLTLGRTEGTDEYSIADKLYDMSSYDLRQAIGDISEA